MQSLSSRRKKRKHKNSQANAPGVYAEEQNSRGYVECAILKSERSRRFSELGKIDEILINKINLFRCSIFLPSSFHPTIHPSPKLCTFLRILCCFIRWKKNIILCVSMWFPSFSDYMKNNNFFSAMCDKFFMSCVKLIPTCTMIAPCWEDRLKHFPKKKKINKNIWFISHVSAVIKGKKLSGAAIGTVIFNITRYNKVSWIGIIFST